MQNNNENIFFEKIKAGKRTYFFDVKATNGGDYYLVITESRRNVQQGEYTYKKNKIFLYKEDTNKFLEALNRTVNHIKTELLPDYDFDKERQPFHKEEGQIN